MTAITQADLLPLKVYLKTRQEWRARAMERRQALRVMLDEHTQFCFEDRLTIQYQIQEMIRTEQLITPEEIQAELDVYNPLISSPENLNATLMLCYEPQHRPEALRKLCEVEHCFYLEISDTTPIKGIANEDLERSTPDKTSAVHFIRFPMNEQTRSKWTDGAVYLQCKHPEKNERIALTEAVISKLAQSLTQTN